MGLNSQRLTTAEVPTNLLPPLESGDLSGWSGRQVRLLHLAWVALAEAQALVGLANDVPLLVALPDREEQIRSKPETFLAQLDRVCGRQLGRSQVVATGRAGGLQALIEACERVRTGVTPAAVALGVDSYLASAIIAQLVAEGRVKTEQNSDGFIPSEAAAAVVICSRDAAERAGWAPLARIAGTGSASEPGSLRSGDVCRGNGLTDAISAALSGLDEGQQVREVYASFTGEAYWSKEWGAAAIRHRPRLHDQVAMHHPGDCWGEVGAACGPALVALAVAGIAKGYRNAPALVFASGDGSERAATLLSTP